MEQHLFEMVFYKIINIFALTFDHFNASLLKKSIHLFVFKSYYTFQ